MSNEESRTPIEGLMSVALENIKSMVDVNTIVGDPVQTPDGATIIPISKVAFGFGAGGSEFAAKPLDAKNNSSLFGGGSGGGVSINPVAFLVVNKDQIRLLPVSNNMNTVDRLVDMIPDAIAKFNAFIEKKCKNDEKKDTAETVIVLDD